MVVNSHVCFFLYKNIASLVTMVYNEVFYSVYYFSIYYAYYIIVGIILNTYVINNDICTLYLYAVHHCIYKNICTYFYFFQ